MANSFIPRENVHDWSEEIGNAYEEHAPALNRLVKGQKRLSGFVAANGQELGPQITGVAVYLISVVLRIFDLAGGRVKGVRWSDIHAASKKVAAVTGDIFPVDEDFSARVRAVEWRAQPHILDEALRALVDRPESDDDDEGSGLESEDAAKIFMIMWVAVECLDGRWSPAKTFEGVTAYEFVDVDAQ